MPDPTTNNPVQPPNLPIAEFAGQVYDYRSGEAIPIEFEAHWDAEPPEDAKYIGRAEFLLETSMRTDQGADSNTFAPLNNLGWIGPENGFPAKKLDGNRYRLEIPLDSQTRLPQSGVYLLTRLRLVAFFGNQESLNVEATAGSVVLQNSRFRIINDEPSPGKPATISSVTAQPAVPLPARSPD